jgi:DNA-binding NarL/FixJ family response regulator
LSDNESPQAAVQDAFRITLETGNIDAFVTVYRTRPDILKLLAMNRQNQEQLKRTLELARDYKLAQAIGLHFPATPATHGPSLLSKREREVLELVSQGLLNKEIARVLFIAESTVKAHVRKICKKLGVRTRTEAAMRAAELSG